MKVDWFKEFNSTIHKNASFLKNNLFLSWIYGKSYQPYKDTN